MKRSIFVLLLLLALGLIGVFRVNEREVAIVTDIKGGVTHTYSTGLHFVLPLINQINYVAITPRRFSLAIPLSFSAGEVKQKANLHNDNIKISYQVITWIDWRVSKPLVFSAYLSGKNKDDEIKRQLFAVVAKEITRNALQQKTVIAFNQQKSLLNKPLLVPELGVIIEQITICSLTRL